MIAAGVLNIFLTCLVMTIKTWLFVWYKNPVFVFTAYLFWKGKKPVRVKSGKTEGIWKRARWIDIHVFQVNSLSYPKVYLLVFLSPACWLSGYSVAIGQCGTHSALMVRVHWFHFIFTSRKMVLTKTLVSQGGRHMLGRKCIANVKNANLWPFKTVSTEELQHRDFTVTVMLGHSVT